MKKLLFILLLAPMILLGGCGQSFNKYEFNEARFIRTGEISYYRVCKEESLPNSDWVDVDNIYCKELKVKYVNDYDNDKYMLVIQYKLFSGEEKTKEVDIFWDLNIYIEYI